MEHRIKIVPLEALSKKQTCEWVASCGVDIAKVGAFLDDSGFQFEEVCSNLDPRISGKAPQHLAGEEAEEFTGSRRDALILEKELRRYMAKQPVGKPHALDSAHEEQEFLALLYQHWDSRIDKNTLRVEFDVSVVREQREGQFVVVWSNRKVDVGGWVVWKGGKEEERRGGGGGSTP